MSKKTGVTLTGDWNRLRSFLSSGQELVDGVNEIIKEEAEKLCKEVQDAIPFGVSNAPSTIARKGDDAPLLESGRMGADEIIVDTYSSGGNFKKYYVIHGSEKLVVSPDGRQHEITYDQLLQILENGAVTEKGGIIPPRPVLTITFDRFKSTLEREIIAKATSKIHLAIRKE